MAGSDPKSYSLQEHVQMIDNSDTTKVKLTCIDKLGERVSVVLHWNEDAYPNNALKRIANDERGMMKPTHKSAPPDPSSNLGELYISKTICEKYGLPPDRKFPGDAPLKIKYRDFEVEVLTLNLRARIPSSGAAAKKLELTLLENCELEGLHFKDGKLHVRLAQGVLKRDVKFPPAKTRDS